MATGFNFSESSAFSPVPVDICEYMMQPQPTATLDLFAPLCDYDRGQLQQNLLVEQWIANLHQPSYESSLPLGFLSYPYFHEYLGEPGFIRKRNERERMRVRSVNEGYARLRDHLPLEPTEKRLSKVETLRGAIKYIKLLEKVLKETDKDNNSNEGDRNNEDGTNKIMQVTKDNEKIKLSITSFNSFTRSDNDDTSISINSTASSPTTIDVENS